MNWNWKCKQRHDNGDQLNDQWQWVGKLWNVPCFVLTHLMYTFHSWAIYFIQSITSQLNLYIACFHPLSNEPNGYSLSKQHIYSSLVKITKFSIAGNLPSCMLPDVLFIHQLNLSHDALKQQIDRIFLPICHLYWLDYFQLSRAMLSSLV